MGEHMLQRSIDQEYGFVGQATEKAKTSAQNPLDCSGCRGRSLLAILAPGLDHVLSPSPTGGCRGCRVGTCRRVNHEG